MGTRGAMGVRIGGVDKIGYVQFDSYPEGWPSNMVKTLRTDLPAIRDKAQSLRVWADDYKPTPEECEALRAYADLGVSEQRIDDPYCLLRKTHGDLAETMKAGVVSDSASFLADSLFCEFAYIANFDDNKFEVYKGFQSSKHEKGRYSALPLEAEERRSGSGRVYYPVALVAEFPLGDIPEDWAVRAFPPQVDE